MNDCERGLVRSQTALAPRRKASRSLEPSTTPPRRPASKRRSGESLIWSAQDNFEWIWAYGDRFGIVYVDFETLERTPKLSTEWFRQTARQNAVT